MIKSIILYIAFATPTAYGLEVLSISDPKHPTKILPNGHYQYFNAKDLRNPQDWASFPWTNAKDKPYRTEQGAHQQWLKVTLKNDLPQARDFVVYHASNLTLEMMELYKITGDNLQPLGRSGAALVVSDRALNQRMVAIPIILEEGETADFLIQTRTTRPFKPDIAVTTREDLADYIQSRNLMNGFCMGIQFIVFLIAAVFAYRLRDHAYAWFALMALSMIILIFVSFGYKDASTLLSGIPLSSSDIGKVIRPGVTMMVLYHTAVFLSLRSKTPILYQWFQATMISLGTLIALSFSESVSNFAISGGDRMIFIGMILMAIASFKSWRYKTPQAGYFLLGTLSLILSVIPWLVVQVFALTVPRLALDLIPIGQAVQIVCLTLGLMAKVRSIDEARIKAETEAGKNEELKSLVRVLSHDLSNPISVTMAYAQKGIASCKSKEHQDLASYFERILRSAGAQVEIIDHIKAMRAIQDGKTSLTMARVGLFDIIKQCEATFEQALHEKNLKLKYNDDHVKNCSVIAEPSSLRHNVVNNLISNAIKFSHPGCTITIDVTATETDVRMTIADQGIGIPKDILPSLFRADKPTSRPGTKGERGTGYGLPLAHAYVEKYGGAITVDSQTEHESPQRHGTRITVSLKKAA